MYQCCFVLAVCETVQSSGCSLAMFPGEVLGLLQPAGLLDKTERDLDISRLGEPPPNEIIEVGEPLRREEDGGRGEAKLEVRRCGFAELIRRHDKVQQIINKLERDSNISSILKGLFN